MSMEFKRKLPVPKDIKEMYPASEAMLATKALLYHQMRDIFCGESDRFLLIVGPCSADHRDSVLDYIERLRRLQDRVSDKILIVPRVFTNKPRTTGIGYKGMLHQPDPNQEPDMLKGLVMIRDLHMTALRDYGFACADELLYPEDYRYLSDLLSYVSVGARSVENQQHRLVASGLDIPVGMKNPTGGDLMVMLNAVQATQHGHTFLYRGWEVKSEGNPLTHTILRGSVNAQGDYEPNYQMDHLLRLLDLYSENSLVNPAVIVDCNHANSGKNPFEQIRIAKETVNNRSCDADIHRFVKGIMIESYIEDGAQAPCDHIYGKSITDPCLGWQKTEQLILQLADML